MLIQADNIDQLLGPSQERYFGAGYRTVTQNIHDLVTSHDTEHGWQLDALVDISSTADGDEAQRRFAHHLSTIDAIVISVTLAMTLIADGTDNVDCARDAILEDVTLKAGANAYTPLSDIPARATLSKYEYDSGHARAGFDAVVGSIRVVATLSWEGAPWNSSDKPKIVRLSHTSELLGDPSLRYFGTGYQAIGLEMHNVRADLEVGRAFSDVTHMRSSSAARDDRAGYIVDALVIASQLAQVLLFGMAGTTRKRAGNLWMRRATFQAEALDWLPNPFRAELSVSGSKLLQRGPRSWLTAEVDIAKFPGVRGSASLAFALG